MGRLVAAFGVAGIALLVAVTALAFALHGVPGPQGPQGPTGAQGPEGQQGQALDMLCVTYADSGGIEYVASVSLPVETDGMQLCYVGQQPSTLAPPAVCNPPAGLVHNCIIPTTGSATRFYGSAAVGES